MTTGRAHPYALRNQSFQVQRVDYFARLIAARRAVTVDDPDLPTDLADQLAAAVRDADTIAADIPSIARRLDRERWTGNEAPITATSPAHLHEVRARILAAHVGETHRVCAHLQQARATQVATLRLPVHDAVCRQCADTYRQRYPGEEERCDWCGQLNNIYPVTPIWTRQWALFAFGNACVTCAVKLRGPDDGSATPPRSAAN
jgi:hypothetical protein